MAIITEEKMQNLDTDIQHAGESVNEDKIINPRYGLPFLSLPMVSRLGQEAYASAIQKIENMGGYISAASITELNTRTPAFSYQLARARDTGLEYYWNPATTPGSWVPTGKNYLSDFRGIAVEEALKATGFTRKTDTGNLFDFEDANGEIPACIDVKGRVVARDFINQNGSFNTIAKSVTRQNSSKFTHKQEDAEGNILFGWYADGGFYSSNPCLKYGLADLRAGSVPKNLVQSLGKALDRNSTEYDLPYSFEVEVSPYQADGTQAQRMATAIKIGPNKLYVVFTQFSTYNNDQQDGRLVARTVDYDLVSNSATVSATIEIVGNKTGNNFRHPHLIRLKDRILLIFNGNTPDLWVYESLDNCASWQLKTQIDTSSEAQLPWALALDSVVRIEDGPFAGRIVAGLFYYSANSRLGTVYSDDDGNTWKRGAIINSADYFPSFSTLNEISIACDSHNDLVFAIRNESLATAARYIIFAKSVDGGQTFQFFDQKIKTPTVGVQIGLKQVAPNTFSGGVPKILASHPVGNNRTQFILRASYDGCESWAYDYKPWPLTDIIGYSSLIPLSVKDYALVVEKGPMLKEQSIAIKFLNLREIMKCLYL